MFSSHLFVWCFVFLKKYMNKNPKGLLHELSQPGQGTHSQLVLLLSADHKGTWWEATTSVVLLVVSRKMFPCPKLFRYKDVEEIQRMIQFPFSCLSDHVARHGESVVPESCSQLCQVLGRITSHTFPSCEESRARALLFWGAFRNPLPSRVSSPLVQMKRGFP